MCHLNIFKLYLTYLSSVSLCYDVCIQARVYLAGHCLTSPTMWVPGMELGSSDLVAGAPTHEAILPALFSLK